MSTPVQTATPPSPFARLRWAAADAGTLTGRTLRHWRRQPGGLLIGLLFPVMTLVMFAFFFGGAITVPGGDYREFLVPGVLAMTVVFGLEATFAAVATDAARGVTDRFRSLPMSQAAPVLGRCLADMLYAVLGLAVLAAAGLAIGWRWRDGPGAAALAFGLLLLLRFALLWVGIFLGLRAGSPDQVATISILVWPIGFLSNAFVAPETMPGWLGAVAAWNPLSATVAAARQLFGNPGWGGDSWPAQHALLLAVVWPLLITAIFLPLSVRAYRRLGG
jgi:ABC transporter DrrB family efflux protein